MEWVGRDLNPKPTPSKYQSNPKHPTKKRASIDPMKSDLPCLSLAEVRAIALRSQGLAENEAPFGHKKAAVLKAVQHLGYVQVDPISVLHPAHHHVLWSRVPDYRPAMLHELQSTDAAVFEYWNHATSYLPTKD